MGSSSESEISIENRSRSGDLNQHDQKQKVFLPIWRRSLQKPTAPTSPAMKPNSSPGFSPTVADREPDFYEQRKPIYGDVQPGVIEATNLPQSPWYDSKQPIRKTNTLSGYPPLITDRNPDFYGKQRPIFGDVQPSLIEPTNLHQPPWYSRGQPTMETNTRSGYPPLITDRNPNFSEKRRPLLCDLRPGLIEATNFPQPPWYDRGQSAYYPQPQMSMNSVAKIKSYIQDFEDPYTRVIFVKEKPESSEIVTCDVCQNSKIPISKHPTSCDCNEIKASESSINFKNESTNASEASPEKSHRTSQDFQKDPARSISIQFPTSYSKACMTDDLTPPVAPIPSTNTITCESMDKKCSKKSLKKTSRKNSKIKFRSDIIAVKECSCQVSCPNVFLEDVRTKDQLAELGFGEYLTPRDNLPRDLGERRCIQNATCSPNPCHDECHGICSRYNKTRWNPKKMIEFITLMIINTILITLILYFLYNWAIKYRKGFRIIPVHNINPARAITFQTDPRGKQKINWHFMYMTCGFYGFGGGAALVFRCLRSSPRGVVEMIHFLLQVCSAYCVYKGFLEAYEYHQLQVKRLDHLSYIHSIIGLITIITFSVQFFLGVFINLFLSLSEHTYNFRLQFKPIHTAIGYFLLFNATVCTLLGISNYGTMVLGSDSLALDDPEQYYIDYVAILICILFLTLQITLSKLYETVALEQEWFST